MEHASPAPLRVLARPSSAAAPPPPLPSPSAPPPDGVVVVGIVGRSSDDVTQLLNRILDARVFGPGGRDRDLFSRARDGGGGGESRIPEPPRLSYHYEEGKGVVYVQLSSLKEGPFADAQSDDLKAMLLMFCVSTPTLFFLGFFLSSTNTVSDCTAFNLRKKLLGDFHFFGSQSE